MPAKSETLTNGPEIIDATQNAVIEAVDNVSELINKTEEMSDFTPHAPEIFYKTPEFWVGMAFILVVVFLAKPVSKAAKNFLIKRREKIIDKINQAEKFRDDAQILLAQYERKFLHAKDEAAEILLKSQKEIELYQKEELSKLEAELRHRQAEVDAGIQSAAEKARKEINSVASHTTVAMVKSYLEKILDSSKQSSLIDHSLENIFNQYKQKKNNISEK